MTPAIDDTRRRERNWTAEHDRILLQLRSAGITMPIIGERIGRTPDACSTRVTRLLTRERPAPADYLGNKIESYMARIAKLNGYRVDDLKRRCYGWRAR